MTFTLKEWNFIKLCLETASRQYEKTMNESRVSDDIMTRVWIIMSYLSRTLIQVKNTENVNFM